MAKMAENAQQRCRKTPRDFIIRDQDLLKRRDRWNKKELPLYETTPYTSTKIDGTKLTAHNGDRKVKRTRPF